MVLVHFLNQHHRPLGSSFLWTVTCDTFIIETNNWKMWENVMINEKVKEFLVSKNLGDRLTEHANTIDTVAHAAEQIGCTEAEIAKTLSFIVDEKPVIVVMAGDGKVNSSKFKAVFHTKPHMIPREQVESITGFLPGGVCPFAVPTGIPVWLDVSMKRFEYVHPAGGNEFTSVRITPEELEVATGAVGWCDVCKCGMD